MRESPSGVGARDRVVAVLWAQSPRSNSSGSSSQLRHLPASKMSQSSVVWGLK